MLETNTLANWLLSLDSRFSADNSVERCKDCDGDFESFRNFFETLCFKYVPSVESSVVSLIVNNFKTKIYCQSTGNIETCREVKVKKAEDVKTMHCAFTADIGIGMFSIILLLTWHEKNVRHFS